MSQVVCVPPTTAITDPPEFQFLIHNVAKPQNVGNIIRSAVAMGCKTCVLVGNRKLQNFGSKGTNQFIAFNHFDTLTDAVKSLRERGFDIVGVEIGENSKSLLNPTECFNKPTCFILGEEGNGLPKVSQDLCDRLIYIPQYGHGTHSLNVSNAAAIVFFQFATWAKYQETKIEGEKFAIDVTQSITKVQKDQDGNVILNERQLAIRQMREAKKQRLAVDNADGSGDADGQQEVQLDSGVINGSADINATTMETNQ